MTHGVPGLVPHSSTVRSSAATPAIAALVSIVDRRYSPRLTPVPINGRNSNNAHAAVTATNTPMVNGNVLPMVNSRAMDLNSPRSFHAIITAHISHPQYHAASATTAATRGTHWRRTTLIGHVMRMRRVPSAC